MSFDYDLFVIGAGSGGVRASRMSTSQGAKVGIAEESRIGGTCVIRGCVPKKLLVYGSKFAEAFEDAAAYGWTVGERSFSWPALIANKDTEIDRLNRVYISLLKNAGVEIHPSRAVFLDPHTLQVGDRRVTAKYILIATGGRPTVPSIPGIEHAITSDDAFHLRDLPRRIAVVGGGYIAVEFAGIFHGLGAETSLLYRGEQILRGFDDDVRHHLAAEMKKKGVGIECRTEVKRIARRDDGALDLELGGGRKLTVDAVMYATGRSPNTRGLGLDNAGVTMREDGVVPVDGFSQTNVPHIYAIGDVTNRVQLTPVAIKEGMAFAATVFGGRPTRADHSDVPTAVFSQPEVGTVGLGEAEARITCGAVDIYKTTFRPMKHTLTGREERTLMKLVVDQATQRVVGAHMVGPDAGEIIQGIGIAVKMKATKADFDATVGIHPTAAEEFVTMRELWAPPQAKAAE